METSNFINKVKKFVDEIDTSVNVEPVEQNDTISVQQVKKLDIETDEADVIIHIHDRPEINVRLETYVDGPQLKTDVIDSVIRISAKRLRKHILFLKNTPSCRLTLTLPKDIAEDWHIGASSGDVIASELISGKFHVTSASGDVRLENIQAEKAVLATSSGELFARKFQVEMLDVETSSGEVELVDIQGAVKGKTSSGEMEITGVRGGELAVKTSSGEIELRDIFVDQAMLKTSSGSVKADQMITADTFLNTSSGDISCSKFSGNVRGTSSSGDITLHLTDHGNLDIDTSSGEITVKFEKELNSDVDIVTNSGDIKTSVCMNVVKQSKKGLEGRTGDGKHNIRIKTNSGDVELTG